MKKNLFLFVLFFVFIITQQVFSQPYYRSKQTGNWNQTASWQVSNDGSLWGDATQTPTSTNCTQITIRNTHIITINSTETIDQCIIETGGRIDVSGGIVLTLNDDIGDDLTNQGTLNTYGTISGSGNIKNSGSMSLIGGIVNSNFDNVGTLTARATCYLNGTVTNASGATIKTEPIDGTGCHLTIENGFTNNGTLAISDNTSSSSYTSLMTINTGTLVNSSTGVIDFQLASGRGGRQLNASTNNQGTIVVNFEATMGKSNGTYTNSGTINVVGGNLNLTSNSVFTNAGTFSISANKRFTLNGGTIYYNSGSTISGTGGLTFQNGCVLILNTNLSTGSLSDLTFSTATINGSSILTNQSNVFFIHSTMNAPFTNNGTATCRGTTALNGAVTNPNSYTLKIESVDANAGAVTIADGFNNSGSLIISDNTTFYSYNTTLNITNGTLVNTSTGIIDFQSGSGRGSRAFNSNLNNQGTVNVNINSTMNKTSGTYSNSGSIKLLGGNLDINSNSSFTNGGGIQVNTGKRLTVNGGNFTYNSGVFSGGGGVTFANSCVLTINANIYNASLSDITLTSSTVNGTYQLYNQSVLNLNSSTINAALNNNGFVLCHGNNNMNGAIVNISIATIRVESVDGAQGILTIANAYVNAGRIELSDATSSYSYTTVLNITSGTLLNNNGTIEILTGSGRGNRTINGNIDNQGKFILGKDCFINGSIATQSANGLFDAGAYVLTGNSFLINSSSTIIIGSPEGISSSGNTGNIQTTTRTFNINSLYKYSGVQAQITGTALPSTVYKLYINNSAGVTLTNNLTTSDTIFLQAGNLYTGSNTLTISSSSYLSGEQAGRYIVGILQATRSVGIGSSDFGGIGVTLDAGIDNIGNVTVIRKSGSTGRVTVGSFSGIDRQWIISSTNPPASGRQVTISWVSSDDNGKNLTQAKIFKSTNSGTNWISFGNYFDASSRSVTFNTTSFSNWTLSDINNPLQYLTANIKVFLQGPFGGGTMTTSLNSGGLIPLSQPYNTSPWNYIGTESVSSVPANVVDWILLEIRSDLNTPILYKACFLKNDGSVVDLDGTSQIKLFDIADGNYYLVVRHRNHLSVMSSSAVNLSPSSAQYDFTNALTKAYGTDAMKELSPGVFGLFAGDGNASGTITSTDRNNVWRPQNGQNGYLMGDFNLSGSVTSTDRNTFWRVNNGVNSQVP